MAMSSRRPLKHMANSSSRQSNINDLPDELLEEIFCRLECPSAVRCKSVRKRWYALISSPDFIRSHISHQHRLSQMQKQRHSQVLFSSAESPLNPMAPTLEAEAITRRFLLGFLKDHKILGESNGWLCCNKRHYPNIYYICNPVTNYWLELPPAPSNSRVCCWGFGFLCDPYYHIDDETHVVTLNAECRFVVVRFARHAGELESQRVEIFTSCTGRWSNLTLSVVFPVTTSNALAFHGKLYFLGEKKILKFDPFNETCTTSNCNFIDLPKMCPWELVITSSGSLGILEILPSKAEIWELNNKTWSLRETKDLEEIAKNFREAYTNLPTSDIFTLLSSIAADHTKVVICYDDYNLASYKLHELWFTIYDMGNPAPATDYLWINVFPVVHPLWQGAPLNYPRIPSS
ncbi:hypothetical protein L6164_017570 [Bauhinia variegata]|uniref:Uncharacterized protein n=1 Tax=Bauhinia variegata TaxID=167791 RepID=A0ACB9N8C1_BAUVA|nr:hypothetical protein L6164_017570 [Bauhinia variegata]